MRPTLLLAAALLAAGCGYRGSPLPPEKVAPERISDLRAEVVEDEVLLSFTAPAKRADGKPLEDLAGFIVYRAEIEPGQPYCLTCGDFPEAVTRGLLTAEDAGQPIVYRDRPRPGALPANLIYSAAAYNRPGGAGKPAPSLVLRFDTPPAAPGIPEAFNASGLVVLAWPEVARLTDGRPLFDLVGYQVYRNGAPAGPPISTEVFAVNERQYSGPVTFTVRAVRRSGETRIAGPTSPPVVASVEDRQAPPAPRGLALAAFPGEVQLRWETPPDPSGIAKIIVYRRHGEKGDFGRLAEVGGRETFFADRDAAADRLYFYKISAVDGSPAANEGESCAPRRIRTLRP